MEAAQIRAITIPAVRLVGLSARIAAAARCSVMMPGGISAITARRHEDYVIQITKYRDEIGNEVDGRQRISDSANALAYAAEDRVQQDRLQ
jgi:hypothetical protein